MRDRLMTVLKIVVSLGLIVWIFSKVRLGEVAAELASAAFLPLLLALLFYLLAMVVNGVKWHGLLRAQQVEIPLPALLEFQFIGFFFNNFLPSANLGGDVMRGYGLAQYTERRADAAVSVVVDRLVGFMAYMSSAAIAGIVAVQVTGRTELTVAEYVALAAVTALSLLLAALLSRRLRNLVARVFEVRLLAPLAHPWDRLSGALNSYRFRYGALVRAFAVALVGIVCTTLANWAVSQAMGGEMQLGHILLFNPLIALVLTLPISIGGIGVSQTAYPFFFGLAGVSADHAVAVSLVMQMIALVASLPGAYFWLRTRRRLQTDRAAS